MSESANTPVEDINVASVNDLPLVRINRMPKVASGRDLAARIIDSIRELTPQHIHSDYRDS